MLKIFLILKFSILLLHKHGKSVLHFTKLPVCKSCQRESKRRMPKDSVNEEQVMRKFLVEKKNSLRVRKPHSSTNDYNDNVDQCLLVTGCHWVMRRYSGGWILLQSDEHHLKVTLA